MPPLKCVQGLFLSQNCGLKQHFYDNFQPFSTKVVHCNEYPFNWHLTVIQVRRFQSRINWWRINCLVYVRFSIKKVLLHFHFDRYFCLVQYFNTRCRAVSAPRSTRQQPPSGGSGANQQGVENIEKFYTRDHYCVCSNFKELLKQLWLWKSEK